MAGFFAFFRQPNTFAFNSNKWMEEEEFRQRSGTDRIDHNAYWAARDLQNANFIANNINPVSFDTNYTFTKTTVENEIYKNKSVYSQLNDMISFNKNGHIMAFDTETIGDFASNALESEREIAGITEIGFYTKKFGRSHNINSPSGSFLFGIDDKQKSWLESALEKKVNGEVLSNAEASGLERASRYSTIQHGNYIFSSHKEMFEGFEYDIIDNLNISNPESIEDIRSGINELYSHYSKNRDAEMSNVIDYINKFASKNGNIIAGQNLQYDINAFNVTSELHGTSKLKEIYH